MSLIAVRVGSPAGLDNLHASSLDDPGAPGPDEIRVQLAASSLNYHDYRVMAVPGAVAAVVVMTAVCCCAARVSICPLNWRPACWRAAA